MISKQPKVFPGHKMLPIPMFASGLRETVVWLSNALNAFAVAENLYICWRVRLLRPQDDRWGMFGKRRNSLISASLGSTAETVTHPFSPQIRHMHPINSYQPCTRKSMHKIQHNHREEPGCLLKWEAIKNVWGVREKKVPRENVLEPQQTITNNRIIGTISRNHILLSKRYHSGDELSDSLALHKGFAVSCQKQESDVLWIFWMIFSEI